MCTDVSKIPDIELTLKIANMENLKVVHQDSNVVMVEPFEGNTVEYNPLEDNNLIYHLQRKYLVSIDFRMGKCYIESKYESCQSGVGYFKEGAKPNRAILEAIYDARDEYL